MNLSHANVQFGRGWSCNKGGRLIKYGLIRETIRYSCFYLSISAHSSGALDSEL